MCGCYRIQHLWYLGVPTKTRLESSIKTFKPHFIYDSEVLHAGEKWAWCGEASIGTHLRRRVAMVGRCGRGEWGEVWEEDEQVVLQRPV